MTQLSSEVSEFRSWFQGPFGFIHSILFTSDPTFSGLKEEPSCVWKSQDNSYVWEENITVPLLGSSLL